MSMESCPEREELFEFVIGRLEDDPSERVAEHVTRCVDCQSTLAAMDQTLDPLLRRLRGLQAAESFCQEAACREAVAKVKGMGPAPSASEHAAAQPASLMLPSRLGEYELLEKLGRGGMGQVYKARHVKLDRIVALKTLSSARFGDARAVVRFEREMKAVGQLRHAHIVEAYDAREIDGVPFLVMEYVDGVTLAQLASRAGPLSVGEACELVRQAALGLQYAHQHGLIHRDVKPSNLMLTWTGLVKLLDLGLARFTVPDEPGEEMTGTGLMMGTADYMAPEQASDSHTVDGRADVYSLGCVLYRLLAGNAPFSGPGFQSTIDKLEAHRHQAPPRLDGTRRDVPAALQAVLDRMLAKSPAGRFESPGDVAAALEPFADAAAVAGLIDRFRQARPDAQEPEPSGRAENRHRSEFSTGKHTGESRGSLDSRRRRTVILVAIATGALLLGLAVAAAVMLIVQRGGRQRVFQVPDNSRVTVREDGQVQIVLPDQQAAKSLVPDRQRRFALMVLRTGGRVHLFTEKKSLVATRREDLPEEPFVVQSVFFWDAAAIGDSDLAVVPELEALEGLSLHRQPITDQAMRYIIKAPKLRWLYLTDTKVTPRGLAYLHSLPQLRGLGLGGLPVTDEVFRALPELKDLENLTVQRTGITDAALKELARYPALQDLDAHRTAITDQGLVYLLKLPRLEILNLEGTAVTDEGLQTLAQIPTLQRLNVKDTKVTAEGIASFRSALPSCQITSNAD